ncbi:PTS system maltose-specific transporter subunit IIA [Lacticaseibacillus rhamnosus MTCC 5462]|nr:PTS system maltose-specific transporter subunit IIA [Lacticaseibacillus rhamnosus MTCC 5462]
MFKRKRDVFTAPVTGELMPLEALKDGVFRKR